MIFLAGMAKHLIEIQRPNETRNAMGEVVQDFVTHISCRAIIRPKGGREVKDSGQIYHYVDTEFTIRYRPGITNQMRIRWGSRYFRISSTMNSMEDRRNQTITAVEIFEEATA